MSCQKFKQYNMGEIDDHTFEQHLKKCETCRAQVEADTRLMNLAKSLKKPVAAPDLWYRIEAQLQRDMQKQQSRHRYSQWMYWKPLRIAAVLVMIIGLGILYHEHQNQNPSSLLARTALEKVEKQEQAYEKAISELQQISRLQFSKLDIELQFLYKDRLETIDQQIAQCKDALATNPANAHIRKYLLIALKDKKETLREIIDVQSSIG